MIHDSPLGRNTPGSDRYSPDLLHPIARADSRRWLTGAVPFSGVDIWNVWDLTWVGRNGTPVVATAEIRIPADSQNLIESKSLKLYLNSFAMETVDSTDDIATRIADDLNARLDTRVEVALNPVSHKQIASAPGLCIDDLDVAGPVDAVDDRLLTTRGDEIVSECLHSHLLRSLCPVTAQPDLGSIVIDYRGAAIDPAGLLAYLVSYRTHNDFHEACVERIFCDLLARCAPEALSVQACYQRRGGIDINPFRSNGAAPTEPLRLWRQ